MEHLPPVPENWDSALAVVAHPDDLEFGSAAAVARWTGQGKTVRYCMVTSGEAGIDALPPPEAKTVREAEQIESARVVGVSEVEFLGFPDGVCEYGLPLRRAICDAVRRHRPDVVITGNFAPTFGSGLLNQADHVAVGRAVLDGVRDAANRWIFPEQLTEARQPWTGVKRIFVAGSPTARHGVDITATFDAGVESLKAHRAYIEGLGWDFFNPAEFLEGFARQGGTAMGVPMATLFEVFNLGWDDAE